MDVDFLLDALSRAFERHIYTSGVWTVVSVTFVPSIVLLAGDRAGE